MSGHDWPIPQTARDTLRQVDRRLQQEELRPLPRRASDFLGPGFGPRAILTLDWSSEDCQFNGIFYCDPGAANSPNADRAWIGQVLADPSPSGVQIVQSYKGTFWPPTRWMRKFETSVGGLVPVFTDWVGI